MSADLFLAVPLALEEQAELSLAGPVIFADRVNANRLREPLLIEPSRDCFLVLLVGAMIAEEDDVAEAGLPEAPRGKFERLVESLLRYGDRAGEAHMGSRRRNRTLRDIRYHRRNERVPKCSSDLFGQIADSRIVLAERHMRAVLLGAADRNDDCRLAGAHQIAQLDPSQLFEKHRLRCLRCRQAQQQKTQAKSSPRHSTSEYRRCRWRRLH